MNTPLKLHYRLWFECEGEHVMGGGLIRLLRKIHALGSLKKAAEYLNIPYRGAWGRIRKAEEAMGISLLESSRQRQKGVTLTPAALILLDSFAQLDSSCGEFLKQCLNEIHVDNFEITVET